MNRRGSGVRLGAFIARQRHRAYHEKFGGRASHTQVQLSAKAESVQSFRIGECENQNVRKFIAELLLEAQARLGVQNSSLEELVLTIRNIYSKLPRESLLSALPVKLLLVYRCGNNHLCFRLQIIDERARQLVQIYFGSVTEHLSHCCFLS